MLAKQIQTVFFSWRKNSQLILQNHPFHFSMCFEQNQKRIPQMVMKPHGRIRKKNHLSLINKQKKSKLVGGWTNPSETYARQIESFPQGSGWKYQTCLSCHNLGMDDCQNSMVESVKNHLSLINKQKTQRYRFPLVESKTPSSKYHSCFDKMDASLIDGLSIPSFSTFPKQENGSGCSGDTMFKKPIPSMGLVYVPTGVSSRKLVTIVSKLV